MKQGKKNDILSLKIMTSIQNTVLFWSIRLSCITVNVFYCGFNSFSIFQIFWDFSKSQKSLVGVELIEREQDQYNVQPGGIKHLTMMTGQCSVAAAPVQSQLKPEAEPSLAEAQPELPSDGSHILANSGSG